MNEKGPAHHSFGCLLLFTVLFWFLSVNHTSAETYTCNCKFDKDDYQATGYFAGTCSYTMDETRKKCTLRRAYDYNDVQKSLVRSDLFKNPFEIDKYIYYKVINMYEQPDDLTLIDPTDLFSYLMRSSYLASPFLKDEEKRNIDKNLSDILKAHGSDILNIFIGKVQKKKFTTEIAITIQKGIVEFIFNIGNRQIMVGTKVLPKIE